MNGQKDALVVFVHGFISAATTWDQMISLLHTDVPEISGKYDLECFAYASPRAPFSLTRRVPSLTDVAEQLAAFMEAKRFERYREITLVGHSQGGLVIQYYLAKTLESGQGQGLARIRQVILFAVPNLGSDAFSLLRRMLGCLPFLNGQERSLRVLDEQIAELREHVLKRIIASSLQGAFSWPIPVAAIFGTEDGLVSRASAAGHFPFVVGVPGDHSSVIRPPGHDDERYRTFVDLLRNPSGHFHLFEVDLYTVELIVKPTPGARILARHGDQERWVETDTEARLHRSVTFSKHNRTLDPFELSYSTRRDGFIDPTFNRPNEASITRQTAYLDYGNVFTYRVFPVAGETVTLSLKLLKAFDRGNRDIHFHMRRRAHIKTYRLKLDLSAFVRAGYVLTKPPVMYFDPQEASDHRMCDKRESLEAVTPRAHDPRGTWEWEIREVKQGILDLKWDAEPARAPAAPDPVELT